MSCGGCLVCPAGLLLVADGSPQYPGHDPCPVVERQVFGAEHRNACLTAPVVKQQRGRHGGDIVRGHGRNTAQSSPMLRAKSCHDLDWLSSLLDEPCQTVSSFGQLGHFRRNEQPEGAGERCLDCPSAVRDQCPYDAERYELGHLAAGHLGWPIETITDDPTSEGIHEALLTGPYGRCVYACDSDVVDHQVVNFRFQGGATATFTMTVFTQGRGRETRLFGTRGEVYGDSRRIRIFDFLTERTGEIDTQVGSDGSTLCGHGGGDFGLMAAFVHAVQMNDPSFIRSGPNQSLASHLMVFRAEAARLSGQVERLGEARQSAIVHRLNDIFSSRSNSTTSAL